MRTPSATLAVLALALLLTPANASSQGRANPRPKSGAKWPAAAIGVRLGYDSNSTGSVLGTQLRVPILRSGYVEVVPNGDITFLRGLKSYQGAVDLVFVSAGRDGGLYVGGGPVWHNTIFEGPGRETRLGSSAVVGLNTPAVLGDVLAVQLEIRWVFLDAAFHPRTTSIGVNVPLW